MSKKRKMLKRELEEEYKVRGRRINTLIKETQEIANQAFLLRASLERSLEEAIVSRDLWRGVAAPLLRSLLDEEGGER